MRRGLAEADQHDLPLLRAMESDLEWTIRYMRTGDASVTGRLRRCVPWDPATLARWARGAYAYRVWVPTAQVRRRLAEALAVLSAAERRAFVLKAGQGLSYASVARLLDVTPGTVAKLVDRARKKLAARRCQYPYTRG